MSGGGQLLSGDTLHVSLDTSPLRTRRHDGIVEALVPTSDRAVRTQAERVINGETDQRRIAERLLTWVATEVTNAVNPGIPNARRALRTRKGDASERAILFVALARSAGLEARPVAGIVAQERGLGPSCVGGSEAGRLGSGRSRPSARSLPGRDMFDWSPAPRPIPFTSYRSRQSLEPERLTRLKTR